MRELLGRAMAVIDDISQPFGVSAEKTVDQKLANRSGGTWESQNPKKMKS